MKPQSGCYHRVWTQHKENRRTSYFYQYRLCSCCWIDLLVCPRIIAESKRSEGVLTGCFGFPSSLLSFLFPINSSPRECFLLISLISSSCIPRSTTPHVQADRLTSKITGVRFLSSPFSPSSLRTCLIAPRRCDLRWSRHHDWWIPRHPTSLHITSNRLHNLRTSTLTPTSEGLQRHPFKVPFSSINPVHSGWLLLFNLIYPSYSVFLWISVKTKIAGELVYSTVLSINKGIKPISHNYIHIYKF